jgi:hypothetical protein
MSIRQARAELTWRLHQSTMMGTATTNLKCQPSSESMCHLTNLQPRYLSQTPHSKPLHCNPNISKRWLFSSFVPESCREKISSPAGVFPDSDVYGRSMAAAEPHARGPHSASLRLVSGSLESYLSASLLRNWDK